MPQGRMACTLVDVNNVRGHLSFMPLNRFCALVFRWAQKRLPDHLIILAVDHGTDPCAFRLGPGCAVVFSGDQSDADTVIVHAVDHLLIGASTVTVVTDDQGLRRRARCGLPATPLDNEWFLAHGLQSPGNPEFEARGLRRSSEQRACLQFHSSAQLARTLESDARSQLQLRPDDDSAVRGASWLSGLMLLSWWPWVAPGANSGADASELLCKSSSRQLAPRRAKGGRRRKSTARREGSGDRMTDADALRLRLECAEAEADAASSSCRAAEFNRWFVDECSLTESGRRLRNARAVATSVAERGAAAAGDWQPSRKNVGLLACCCAAVVVLLLPLFLVHVQRSESV